MLEDKNIIKILVIRLSSLGDIVLTEPSLYKLKERFPHAHISFILFKKYEELLINNPYINKIICFEYRRNPGDLIRWFKIVYSLRRTKFDFILDLHANSWCFFRTIFWTFLFRIFIKSKWKLKVERPSFKIFLKQLRNSTNYKHVIDYYFEPVRNFGIYRDKRNPEIYLSSKEINFASEYIIKSGIRQDDILVGISPGASYPTKRWPEQKFIELCKKLSLKKEIKILIFGDLKDKKLIERIIIQVNYAKIMPAIDLSLIQLTSIISRCKVFITNDSGPMHIAAAVKVPVIAIFGPTHPILGFAPLGENNIVFCSNTLCSPCSRWGEKPCKFEKQLCFENIQVDDILETLNRFFNIDF